MDHVVSGVEKFQKEIFPSKAGQFSELATGQSPRVLFITCSDSRIDPNLLTQMDPGELFICRNAGNIIPPHSNQTGGMTASIEYAVAALGVEHVIICGHSDCGAMKGAISPEGLDALPHVKEWLGHSRVSTEVVAERHGSLCTDHLPEVIEENVVQQIQHIRTHPAVAAKLATKKIQLHGWIYDIKTGGVKTYDSASEKFIPLAEAHAS